jgi:hypothetical protein
VAWWDERSAQPRLLRGTGPRRAYTRRRWPLVGILSFADGCSMLSTGMAPLFAGLGLCYHAPGGVAAPPGATSLSPSRQGLRSVSRRACQDEQGRMRARWCRRDTLASPEEIAPFQNVRTHAGRRSLLQGTGVPGSEADLHLRWREGTAPEVSGRGLSATGMDRKPEPPVRDKQRWATRGRALCMRSLLY